jgi:hypothetical protein
MWLALTDPSLDLTGQQLLAAFEPYRPDGLTAKAAINTLHDHLRHADFRADTNNLIVDDPSCYATEISPWPPAGTSPKASVAGWFYDTLVSWKGRVGPNPIEGTATATSEAHDVHASDCWRRSVNGSTMLTGLVFGRCRPSRHLWSPARLCE